MGWAVEPGWAYDQKWLARTSSRYAETPAGCWEWSAGKSPAGYGKVKYRGRDMGAHRVMWLLLRGDPGALDLDHLCRNRACVNPWHLEPVSRAENTRRGYRPNRDKSACPKGHAYDDANTYEWRGQRHCRACRHDRQTQRRQG